MQQCLIIENKHHSIIFETNKLKNLMVSNELINKFTREEKNGMNILQEWMLRN